MMKNIKFPISAIIFVLVLLSCRGGAINNREEYTAIPLQVLIGNQSFNAAVGSSSYTHGNGVISGNRTCAEGRTFRLFSSRALPINQTSSIEFTAYKVVNCPARQFTAQNDYFKPVVHLA